MDSGSSPAATSERVLVVPKVHCLAMPERMLAQWCSPSEITSVTRCKPIHGRSAKTSMFSMVTAAIAPVIYFLRFGRFGSFI
jgi:hypothetical protein